MIFILILIIVLCLLTLCCCLSFCFDGGRNGNVNVENHIGHFQQREGEAGELI